MIRRLIFLLICIPAIAFSQDNAVTGRLIDNATKAPIANATVKRGTSSTQTNHLGYFQLSAASGDTLIVTHQEYGELAVTVPAQTRFAIALDKVQADGKVAAKPAAGLDKLMTGNRAVYNANEVDKIPTPAMGEDRFLQEWAKSVASFKDDNSACGTGAVEIYFVVDAAGKIVDSGVEKGISKSCDSAALKAFRRTKVEWKPGLLDGLAVAVRRTISYNFGSN